MPDALHIVVGSKGSYMTRAPYSDDASTDNLTWGRVGNLIWVGSANLTFHPHDSGLRVAILNPDRTVATHELFDVASSTEDIEGFAGRCANAPIDTVLIVGTSGHVQPRGTPNAARQIAYLNATLENLGAHLRPFTPPSVSYALVAVRLSTGWVKLAETLSREKGIVLGFTLKSNLANYLGFEGDTFIDELTGDETIQRHIGLDSELGSAVEGHSSTYLRPVQRVGADRHPALYAPLPSGGTEGNPTTHQVAWDSIELGYGPTFRTQLALLDDAWAKSNGVIFSVHVDGIEIARKPILPEKETARLRWHPWEVDLSAFARRVVNFELRVDSNGDSTKDDALWGMPSISFEARARNSALEMTARQ